MKMKSLVKMFICTLMLSNDTYTLKKYSLYIFICMSNEIAENFTTETVQKLFLTSKII